MDRSGNLVGTFIPAGQEPPTSPPEPPTASAAVGRRPRPGAGGPGVMVVDLKPEYEDTIPSGWQRMGDD